ncbi:MULTISPECIES: alpha-D-ribose 1-methylphosphonate 5-phosphate C-P-lyase PhnJ [unclassified Sinorhizobium]|uniref:alpha-D-ribose 1-methylphosphonate 5-phosphate C-P-lyase PhnJ n=1 Tax=unclassified Sinorhizobium TaxID=2613772 RepID=UPI0024C22373|nr:MULTISPECIES: alpha-D-ribose 1-methylphosphonate 5-phosphate C-P-lyase PhnJ [unclassified Sinorhizobium]MDK1378142.1 alpha-D-ribose 1-methylphosphonate 5-phosphate C-P-lyase PhnJ [Sinorhizobium sp. 6-70]MDK1483045.1 alpha-D-ribose 1-methylphosphonate 5-phosphate C-P-lyase PhnJ [Sinorhizobium sp. 6-117]
MIPVNAGLQEQRSYNFGYLNEVTKRMLRRAILKAVSIPGFQVPIAGHEMPLPPGWGTGGMQITAALIGRSDVLKVIDQGADDSINATSIRRFFERVTDCRTTSSTREATIIQTRHRIPEERLSEGHIIVLQVPLPEPMRSLEPSETVTRRLHAFQDYGMLYVRLYEDMVRLGDAGGGTNHPVLVNGRYFAAPSPIPTFDNHKLDRSPALMLFGAGRHRRIYAIPPHTSVENLSFRDRPFVVRKVEGRCSVCGSTESYLDVISDDNGISGFVCSDTSFCATRRIGEPVGSRA